MSRTQIAILQVELKNERADNEREYMLRLKAEALLAKHILKYDAEVAEFNAGRQAAKIKLAKIRTLVAGTELGREALSIYFGSRACCQIRLGADVIRRYRRLLLEAIGE